MIHTMTHVQTAYGDQIPAPGTVLYLPVAQIYTEKPLKTVKKRNESIRMVQNIRKYGLPAPLCVYPTEVFPGAFRYRITEGEELWQAALLAGLAEIPCRIVSEGQGEAEIETIFAQIRRKELHFLEQAAAFQLLVRQYALTQSEIARRSGFSQSAVANKLRLLQLSEAERAVILQKGLTERHARALLRLREPQKRALTLDKFLRGKLTVSEAETLVEAVLLDEGGISAPESKQTSAENRSGRLEKVANGEKGTESGAFEPCGGTEVTPLGCVAGTNTPPKPTEMPPLDRDQGFRPRRFVLHTLQPLYNSLEHTLSIFRKTGREAYMHTEEGADGVQITIHIPASER
ncbi:MAG: ParB/RepB/Spo0J family partition protein [Ruminococcaceae bacterium]|nr:ParB/RepB/Spo0J family partition protein [Oscillospiraceae bacterium]